MVHYHGHDSRLMTLMIALNLALIAFIAYMLTNFRELPREIIDRQISSQPNSALSVQVLAQNDTKMVNKTEQVDNQVNQELLMLVNELK